MLRDRIKSLRKKIIKNGKKGQDIKNRKHIRVRCDICKIYFHRASYARHLKSGKHIEKLIQNKVNILRKIPIKRIEKRKIIISDTKVDNL